MSHHTARRKLSDLVSQLLAKDPSKRPESAAAVAAELTRILDEAKASAGNVGESGEEPQELTKRLRNVSITDDRGLDRQAICNLGFDHRCDYDRSDVLIKQVTKRPLP